MADKKTAEDAAVEADTVDTTGDGTVDDPTDQADTATDTATVDPVADPDAQAKADAIAKLTVSVTPDPVAVVPEEQPIPVEPTGVTQDWRPDPAADAASYLVVHAYYPWWGPDEAYRVGQQGDILTLTVEQAARGLQTGALQVTT